jgi:hypothetical protein
MKPLILNKKNLYLKKKNRKERKKWIGRIKRKL